METLIDEIEDIRSDYYDIISGVADIGQADIKVMLDELKKKEDDLTILFTGYSQNEETTYNYTLIEFQKLLKKLNITIYFSKFSFMADFEINLRKSISNNFPKSENMGCYFHFIKNLYCKMKKLGLTKKKDIKNNLNFFILF